MIHRETDIVSVEYMMDLFGTDFIYKLRRIIEK